MGDKIDVWAMRSHRGYYLCIHSTWVNTTEFDFAGVGISTSSPHRLLNHPFMLEHCVTISHAREVITNRPGPAIASRAFPSLSAKLRVMFHEENEELFQ